MSFDTDLVADVSDELFWDPKVDNTAVAVSADDGKITLRGTVGSLREKREARKAAERVFGVISVDNKLQVKLMNDDKRGDAEVRRSAPRSPASFRAGRSGTTAPQSPPSTMQSSSAACSSPRAAS
jgi:hypothetical protein